jgi:hypothetical protein
MYRYTSSYWSGFVGASLAKNTNTGASIPVDDNSNAAGTWQGYNYFGIYNALKGPPIRTPNQINTIILNDLGIQKGVIDTKNVLTSIIMNTDLSAIASLWNGGDPSQVTSYNILSSSGCAAALTPITPCGTLTITSPLTGSTKTYSDTQSLLTDLSALVEPLTLTSFTTGGVPKINYLGTPTPIQNIYFNAGIWGITSQNSKLSGDITQEVTLDFVHSTLTNSYSVAFKGDAKAIFSDIPQQNEAINFSKLKTLGNNPNLIQLPTNLTSDGSNLTMTGSFVVNNKSLILPNASSIENASAAFLGAYISKGNAYLIGTQRVPGVINH